jgi:hypothetical protein
MKKSMPKLPTHNKSKDSLPKGSVMSMPKGKGKMMKSKKGC